MNERIPDDAAGRIKAAVYEATLAILEKALVMDESGRQWAAVRASAAVAATIDSHNMWFPRR